MRSSIKRKLTAAAIFAAIGGIGLLTYALIATSAGKTVSAPPRPIPPHGTGFATSLTGLSPSDLDRRLSNMQAAGATWVRSDLNWSDIQDDGPTSFKWQAYDRIVQAANAHGLQTLFIIDFTPSWARPSDCANSDMCAPASATAYAHFAGQAAAHFEPMGVHSWEIWNEPNISYRYHPGVDVAGYTAMLKGAYVAINTVDPSADIIAASTAPSATDATDLTPSDFLTELYQNGAQGYFTAISTHPYTYPKTPNQSGPLDAWGQLTTMHNIMAANGDGSKQIWITEFGAPTNGPANKPSDVFVSENVQAQILSEAVTALKSYGWSGPLFWYDYQDSGTSTKSTENFYGLVRADGSRKPAYDVFKHASTVL